MPRGFVLQPPDLSAQGVLLYLHALHRTFPQALTLRGTALLGWAPTAPRTPGFCPLPTLYCTPPEAAALPLRSAALRVQLLFALQTRALRVLEARLPNELHDALAALRDGWAELAHDLALGTLSPQPGLPEEVRGRLQALLVPDGTRAAELWAECERGFEGIVRRLWPQLQVVVVGTVRGGERLYCDALSRAACEGLPLYCPWYRVAGGECWGCSIPPSGIDLLSVPYRGDEESGLELTAALCPALLGVNLWPKEPTPRFVLCPEWAFCEFLPCPAEEEEKQHTVLLGELWEGREYTLILTARPREYRCSAVGLRGLCTPPQPHALTAHTGAVPERCCRWPVFISSALWWSPCAGEVTPALWPSPLGRLWGCTVLLAPPMQALQPCCARRESQALSVRGESIPEEQFCRSLCRAVGMWPGARLMDYICVESTLLGEHPQSVPVTRLQELVAAGGRDVLVAPPQVPSQGPVPPITRCSWSCGACGTCRRGNATR